jgi:hypothetical protein
VAEAAQVFVSYSRNDKERVLELTGKLRAAGVSLWLDTSGIDAATLWGEQIVNALESAKVLLLMLTESAVRSDNVAKEVMLVSERRGHILPVHLEPLQIPPSLKYQQDTGGRSLTAGQRTAQRRPQPTKRRALRNRRIQPLYSPASAGRQEFCR